jgi:hypothetical protein
MIKFIRKIYYKVIPTYKRLDFKYCTWEAADKLINEDNRWSIAKEDENLFYPLVAIEIKERILE